MNAMAEYYVTPVEKTEQIAVKEVDRLVKSMIIPRLFRKTYSIEEVKLIYVPYMINRYEIDAGMKSKKSKKFGEVYISNEVNTKRKKAFTEAQTLELVKGDGTELTAEPVGTPEDHLEDMRRELIFKILPRNLKVFKEFKILNVETKIFFRPQYLIRYRLYGKMRVYKVFGDKYNL